MSSRNRRILAGGLLVIGFGLTVLLGVLSAGRHPPSTGTAALLVVLAGLFQFGSANQFNAIGKAPPGLARSAVRNLLRMSARAHGARLSAEAAFDSGKVAEVRQAIGFLSVDLSWIEEGLLGAVDDWVEFHGDAVSGLIGDDDGK